MRRSLVFVVIVVIAAAAVTLAMAYRSRATPQVASTAAPPARVEPKPTASEGEPRGEVSIDPQRQHSSGLCGPGDTATLCLLFSAYRRGRRDERRFADVNVKLDGWIRDLFVDYTGQPVRKGQPLFTFYSPELIATENEFLLALRTRDQMKDSPMADAREYATRLVDAARQRLARFDLPAEQLTAIESERRAVETITFWSPASGYVIEKQAIAGMHVTPGQTLYKLADLSTVWIEADVYEQEMAAVRVGAPATVALDAYPSQNFAGRAIYIYPYVDENSRTVKVRMQFANPGGRLKPGMFAHVELRSAGGSGLSHSGGRGARLGQGADRLRRAGRWGLFAAARHSRATPPTSSRSPRD